jgi:hypothetical protein
MSEVHDLVYHGHGGFPYDQVYNMPIQYRKYHIRKINDYLEKKSEAESKSSSISSSTKQSLSRPNVPQADFTTNAKAPKK